MYVIANSSTVTYPGGIVPNSCAKAAPSDVGGTKHQTMIYNQRLYTKIGHGLDFV